MLASAAHKLKHLQGGINIFLFMSGLLSPIILPIYTPEIIINYGHLHLHASYIDFSWSGWSLQQIPSPPSSLTPRIIYWVTKETQLILSFASPIVHVSNELQIWLWSVVTVSIHWTLTVCPIMCKMLYLYSSFLLTRKLLHHCSFYRRKKL